MNIWQPLTEANLANPFPMYENIRSDSPYYRAQTGEIIVTGYHEINQILKNKELYLVGNGREWLEKGVSYFKQKDIDLSSIAQAINKFILLLNPPEHQEIRRFVAACWNEKEVKSIIQANIESLIAELPVGKFDFIEAVATKLPAKTMATILGLSSADYTRLHNLGEQMVKALDFYLKLEHLVTINAAAKEFIEIFSYWIDNPPNDGLIRKMVEQNNKRMKPLSKKALVSISIFLFVAGEETTVSLLSTGLYHLIKKELWKDLNPHEMPAIVEELLRYDGPVHLLGRIVAKDHVTQGISLKKGDILTLCLAAANRDPSIYQNPGKFDKNRNPKHLAFGTGNHYCLGDWLAREQTTLAFQNLLLSHRSLGIAEENLKWKEQYVIRRLKKLPVYT